MRPPPVLIVGAGPTGLVLAIELARRGVPFHLIDKRPAPLHWDRASVIKSRSLEIFDALGLSAAFLSRGKKIRGADFYGGGARRASFRFDEVDSPFPFTLGLSESVTEALLTDELVRLGGHVERGVEFANLRIDERGLHVHLRSGAGVRSQPASWIVGTDGYHSSVREAAGIAFIGHDYERRWGVVDVHLADWPHDHDVAAVMFDPPLIPVPINDGKWRINFRPNDDNPVPIARIEQWLQQIAPGATVAEADQPQFFRTHFRIAERFRAGPVLLAGDAAHACSSIEGHGMNAGIQDAFNLGWKLALVATGQASETLLDSYDIERRGIAEAVGVSGDSAEENAARGGPEAIHVVGEALSTADGRLEAALAESEIGLGYEASPLLEHDCPAPSPTATRVGYRVGEAAPLVSRSSSTRLHQLLAHTAHTLILLTDEAEATADDWQLMRELERRRAPHLRALVVTRQAAVPNLNPERTFTDATGAAHAILGEGHYPCLCVVRPDGHLGHRGTTPAGVEAYLARILA